MPEKYFPEIIKEYPSGAVTFVDTHTKKPGVSIFLNGFFNKGNSIDEGIVELKNALKEVDTWPQGQKPPEELIDEVHQYLNQESFYLFDLPKGHNKFRLVICPVSAEPFMQWFPNPETNETYAFPRQHWFIIIDIND